MGEVWRAVDEVLSRVVAVKVMLPSVAEDPDFARRFLAEATAMARVNHPAVASIHDFGDGFLVMEFVDGESLAQVLARGGRLAPADTMRLIAQAADGLQAVHDRGIVHRDIKPANLLIRRDGAVVLTDFGIARRDDASRHTASGAVLGTPSYLSPEQVLGQDATFRSDVYALGLTAYECLAGRRPFEGDNPYAVALQRLRSAPKTIGITLPAAVLAVVERALATDPAHRWPTAAAMATAARESVAPPVGGRSPGSAAPTSPPQERPSPGVRSSARSTRVRKAVLAASAAVLLAGGAAVWAFNRDTGHATATGPTITGPSAAASAQATAAPAGFASCGTRYCPSAPMCWAGLTEISGEAYSPQSIPCAETHYWETFAAVEMPASAATAPPDNLLELPDVAKACSASILASRSHDRTATISWIRAAWPVQFPKGGPTLLHCLAQPPSHESAGSAF
jgi:serine/threonine-protein kinase